MNVQKSHVTLWDVFFLTNIRRFLPGSDTSGPPGPQSPRQWDGPRLCPCAGPRRPRTRVRCLTAPCSAPAGSCLRVQAEKRAGLGEPRCSPGEGRETRQPAPERPRERDRSSASPSRRRSPTAPRAREHRPSAAPPRRTAPCWELGAGSRGPRPTGGGLTGGAGAAAWRREGAGPGPRGCVGRTGQEGVSAQAPVVWLPVGGARRRSEQPPQFPSCRRPPWQPRRARWNCVPRNCACAAVPTRAGLRWPLTGSRCSLVELVFPGRQPSKGHAWPAARRCSLSRP